MDTPERHGRSRRGSALAAVVLIVAGAIFSEDARTQVSYPAPTGLTAVAAADPTDSIDLTWNAVAVPEGLTFEHYTIGYGATSGATFPVQETVTGASTTSATTSLGQTVAVSILRFRIRAVYTDSSDQRRTSNWHTMTTAPALANAAPSFTSSATASVAENTTEVITLEAEDPDAADSVTFSLTGGADEGKFSLSGAALSFKAAPDFEAPTDAGDTAGNNTYVVVVTATGGTGDRAKTAAQTITVTVTDANEPPSFTSTSTASVPENTATAVLTVVAEDLDAADSVTGYSLSGDDAGDFSITSGGVLTFSPAPDFENAADTGGDNTYEVVVTATSGGTGRVKTATQTVTVTVTDVNEAPSFTSSATPSVAENTTDVLTVAATDEDPADTTVTFSLTGGADQSKFSLSGADLSFKTAPDFENPDDAGDTADNNTYVVQVTARSGGTERPKSTTRTITVTVTDVNEPPAFTSSSTASVEENTTEVKTVTAADEDAADSTVTYELSGGADRSKFAITSGGALTFSSAPDFENPDDAGDTADNNTYVVEVTAESGGSGREETATQTVTVTVTDVNEPPAAPGAPTVTSVSASELGVSWAAPDNAGRPSIDDYDLQYRASGGGWTLLEDVGTDLAESVGSLDDGTSYDVQVRAINDEGDGAWSPSGSSRTAPAKLTGLAVDAVVDGLEVSWTATRGSTGTKVQWKSGSETWDTTRTLTSTTDSATIAGLTAGVAYTVRVIATHPDTPDAEPSDEVSGTPLAEVEIAAASTPVDEGTAAEFTLTRSSGASNLEVTVSVTQVPTFLEAHRATNPSERTVTFTGNAATATLSLPTHGDSWDEDDGTFSAQVEEIAGDGYVVSSTGAGADVEVRDDDPTPVLSVADASFAEDAGTVRLCATMTPPSHKTVGVALATADGTALSAAGKDYTALDATLAIAPGSAADSPNTEACADLAITDDALLEDSETLAASLGSPTNATVSSANGRATVTITDDETSAAVDLTASTLSIEEDSASPLEVCAALAPLAGKVIAVEISTADGTAEAGRDYGGLASAPLVFPVETGRVCEEVTIVDNTADDGDRAFTVSLAAPTGLDSRVTVGGTTGTATATIVDEDVVPGAPQSVNAEPWSSEVRLTWAAGAAGSDPITGYEYRYKGSGSYGGWTDVGLVTSKMVTGLTNGQAHTFQVRAVNVVGAGAESSPESATPEFSLTRVTIDASDTSLDPGDSEEDGGALAVFTVRRTGATTRPLRGVDVLSTRFTGSSRNENVVLLNFGAGQSAVQHERFVGTQHTRVTAEVLERTGYVVGTPSVAEVAVVTSGSDLPGAPGSLTATPGGGTATLAWTAGTSGGSPVTGHRYRQRAGASFGLWQDIPSSAPGGTNATSYTITGLVNGTEYAFQVQAVNDTGGGPPSNEASATPTGADRTAPVLQSVAVDGATLTLTYNEALDAGSEPPASAYSVSVDGGAGAAPSSVSVSGRSVTLTLTAGVANGQSVTVSYVVPTGDGATPVQDVAGNDAPALSGRAVRNNTPKPGFTLLPPNVTVDEGGTGEWTVALSESPSASVTVDVTSADPGVATVAPPQLTFTPANWFEPQTVTVTTAHDDDSDDETVTVTHGGPGFEDAVVTVTVDDDEAAELSIDDAAADEGAGTMTFTLSLSAPSSSAVEVQWRTGDDTGAPARAAAGRDYAAVTDGVVTFAPDETSRDVTVTLVDDASYEAQETFRVVLAAVSSGTTIADPYAVGTITDNDDPPVAAIDDAAAPEDGGRMVFTVRLSPASGREASLRWSTRDGTATAGDDYTSVTGGTVSFAPGETERTLEVELLEDGVHEGDETFTVTLSGPTGVALAGPGADSGATGTITDDEATPQLAIADAEAGESAGAMVFTVTLDPPSTETVTAGWGTADGTATAGDDYEAVTGGTVSFAPGETERTLEVALLQDTVHEGPEAETFTVTLSAPGNAELGDATATGSIADDDGEPTISISAAAAGEDAGTMIFEVTLSVPVGGATATARWATADGTATAGRDYTGVTDGTVSFAPGETARTVTVALDDDGTHEADETFTVSLRDPQNAVLGTAAATGTITDDDDPPVVSIADAAAREDAGSIAFTVRLSPASGREASVRWRTGDGTATAGDDYEAVTGGTVTFAPGETERTLEVALLQDEVREGTAAETFTVTLSDPRNARLGAATATASIGDDEGPPGLSVADVTVAEDAGSATFTVTLAGSPSEDVTVDFEVVAGTAASGTDFEPKSGTLTFDRSAGETTATIVVNVVDDDAPEDEETFLVRLGNAEQSEDEVRIEDGEAIGTIIDDDVDDETGPDDETEVERNPGLVLSATSLTPAEGGAATYTVALRDRPSAQVTVTIAGFTGTDLTVTPARLVFGPESWSTPQTVRVAAARDDDEVDDEATLTHRAASADPGYAGLGEDLVVTVSDDTRPPAGAPPALTVTPTALTVPEGDEATYEVVLRTQPSAPVTVRVESDAPDVTATPRSLTFGASDWSTPRTVTVSVADDDEVEDDAVARVTHTVRSGDHEAEAAQSVRVTVPGFETVGDTFTLRVPATGAPVVSVPSGTPVPEGTRVSLPAALAGRTVSIRPAGGDPALASLPRGFRAGDAVVAIALEDGATLGGSTATVCLPAPDGGRVFRNDGSSPEWIELEEPAGGSPDGLACGVTDGFSLFAVISGRAAAGATDAAAARGWLARFGRTAARHVLDGVGERLAAPRRAGFRGTLAGHGLPGAGGAVNEAGAPAAGGGDNPLMLRLDTRPGAMEIGRGARVRELTLRELVGASAFDLAGDTPGDGSIALWGRGSLSGFEGSGPGAAFDGDVATATLGADYASGSWTLGLALSHSRGDGTGRRDGAHGDTFESSLTGLYPYAGLALSDRVSVWGAGGHGRGELAVREGAGTLRADMDLTMAAAGARAELSNPPYTADGLMLALESDALFVWTSTEARPGLEAQQAKVSRLRLGIEASRSFELGGGASLTPFYEAAVRRDDGDAENGAGVDMGGGLAWSDRSRGLSAEVTARGVLAHESDGFRDWGLSGALAYDPHPSPGRGLTMSLRHTSGSAPAAGTGGAFTGGDVLTGLATTGDGSGSAGAGRLETEIGYGLPMFGGVLTGTPHAGLTLSGSRRDYRIGWRLGARAGPSLPAEMNLEAIRNETDTGAPSHGIRLTGALRW